MTAAFSRTNISHDMLLTTIKNVPPSLNSDSAKLYDAIRAAMETTNRRNVTSRQPIGYARFIPQDDDK